MPELKMKETVFLHDFSNKISTFREDSLLSSGELEKNIPFL